MTCEYPNCREQAVNHFVASIDKYCVVVCDKHSVYIVLGGLGELEDIVNHISTRDPMSADSVRYFFHVD